MKRHGGIALTLGCLLSIWTAGLRSDEGRADTVRWVFETGACLAHEATVIDDVVYVASCNGRIHALASKTGRPLWQTHVSGRADGYYFHAAPLVTPTLVIFGADTSGADDFEAALHALDRSTGTERWRFPAGPGVASVLVTDGTRLYAAALDGRVVAVEIASGRLEWSFAAKVWGWEGVALAGDHVVVGGLDGTLTALDPRRGTVAWQVATGVAISTSVVSRGDDIYFGTADGQLHKVDARSGERRASLGLDQTWRPRGRPVVTEGAVLVLLADRQGERRALVAVDHGLGAVRWRRDATESWTTAGVFASASRAAVGTERGEVLSICLADGRDEVRVVVGAPVRSVGGDGDMLYVGTTEGVLHALEAPERCDGR